MEDVLVEPLYKSEMVYSMDEFIRYNKAVYRENLFKDKKWIAGCGLGAIILSIAFASGLHGVQFFIRFSLVLASWVMFTLFLTIINLKIILPRNAKKTLKSSKIHYDTLVSFAFHPDWMEIATLTFNAKVKYTDLYKIIQTPTHFYLMISNNQGHIIVKDSCPLELQKFLSEIAEQVNKKK